MTDPLAAMFADIGQDYAHALANPVTDAGGTRHWRDVVFGHSNGFRPLTLFVSTPRTPKPAPLVVFVHGGGWMLGHPMVSNPVYRALDIDGHLLRAGYAVAKISYRLSAEAVFPAQLHDCKAAVRFLRNRAALFGVDANRFAAMGDSAGGHLVALLGLTGNRPELEQAPRGRDDFGDVDGSSAVQAVVDWFGPTDFLTMQQQAIPGGQKTQNDPGSPESMMLGGPVQDRREAAIAASPVTYVSASAPSFLIQHGTLDRLVPIGQSRELHQALLAAGADSTLREIEGADHCFWGVDGRGIMADVTGFLDRVLS
jgi:acetyl esterase/lipase